MRITLDTDTSDCPGAICKIVADDGRDILVQTDWDAPGIASTFGWFVSNNPGPNGPHFFCFHSGTDGTIDCPDCGTTAATFINDAIEFIRDHDGESVDDPGYFDGGDA